MVKTRSPTRNQNHDDDDHGSIRNKRKTRNKHVVAPWSELNHDVLLLVMMRLSVVDLVAFSGVCKSWRSVALYDLAYKEECYLKDFEGRKPKTIIPHSAARICIGITCGYLILFGRETKDFWLVNPITRHQLHFPNYPYRVPSDSDNARAILVFSPSIKGWVFVMAFNCCNEIFFSIAGKGAWGYVYSTLCIHDLLAFKGKIYALNRSGFLCELRVHLNSTLTSLKIKNFPEKFLFFYVEFVSSGENLYVIGRSIVIDSKVVYVLDFDEMELVVQKKKRIREYVLFLSGWRKGATIKPESWATDPSLLYKSPKDMIFAPNKWYFPLLCLEVDLID